jgi:hypothetical protein
MNETAAIVGLYGAVDEAVREDSTHRDAVARLLPQYADDEFSWYEDFTKWVDASREAAKETSRAGVEEETSEAGVAQEAIPGLVTGLQRLAGSPPTCRMRPRRLFALAVAMRAFPEMLDFSTDLGGLAIESLAVKGLASHNDAAQQLLELLGHEERLDKAGKAEPDLQNWWEHFLEEAHPHLLADLTGMRPRPCSGRVVTLPNKEGLAAAFITEFPTSEVGFDQAIRFLKPSVWKKCRPDFWCEMKELRSPPNAGGAYTYHEVVSSDCDAQGAAWFNAETELDFVFRTLPNEQTPEVAITNYQLSHGQPKPGDLILVDEGTLVVAKTEGGQSPLLITTTKRIQFDHGFSAAALALIMCAFGYADTAGDLLCCAASNVDAAAKGKKVGTAFPGIAPQVPASGGQARPRRAAPKAKAKATEQREASASNLADIFQDSANMWASLLRGSAKALERGAKDLPPAPRPRSQDRKEQ